MYVLERLSTNSKCRDSGVLGCKGSSMGLVSNVIAGLGTRLRHPLPAFTGEAGALNSSSWISIGGGPYPRPDQSRMSCHSGGSAKHRKANTVTDSRNLESWSSEATKKHSK
ncbi:hypothetical protein J6590_060431 [Homalodisca vitripennis]|nr:hypothetical protein J6590_060431 [Homalodisca vitripennis]